MKILKKATQGFNPIVKLVEEDFIEYYADTKQQNFYDL